MLMNNYVCTVTLAFTIYGNLMIRDFMNSCVYSGVGDTWPRSRVAAVHISAQLAGRPPNGYMQGVAEYTILQLSRSSGLDHVQAEGCCL